MLLSVDSVLIFPFPLTAIVLVIRLYVKIHWSTSVRPSWEGSGEVDAEPSSKFRASKPRRGHVTFLLDLCGVAFLALAVFATVLRETRV